MMLCGEGKIPALFLFVLGVCCFAACAGVVAAAWTETYITGLDYAAKGYRRRVHVPPLRRPGLGLAALAAAGKVNGLAHRRVDASMLKWTLAAGSELQSGHHYRRRRGFHARAVPNHAPQTRRAPARCPLSPTI